MRFLIDAQLPPSAVDAFVIHGHQGVHVADVGLLLASDHRIATYAVRSGLVLVTKDADFVTMRRFTGSGPQIVWVRIGNTSKKVVTARLASAVEEIVRQLAAVEMIVEIR